MECNRVNDSLRVNQKGEKSFNHPTGISLFAGSFCSFAESDRVPRRQNFPAKRWLSSGIFRLERYDERVAAESTGSSATCWDAAPGVRRAQAPPGVTPFPAFCAITEP